MNAARREPLRVAVELLQAALHEAVLVGLVVDGEVRPVAEPRRLATQDAAGFRGTQGGSNVAAQIASWVERTFTRTTIGGVTVYDLSAS